MRAESTVPHPLVAFVGATTAAIPPAAAAFGQHFPEARLWNLLDDRLIVEALEAGGLTDDLTARMSRLIRYALDAGADGVLLTCSMYGSVAHRLAPASDVPLYASDDAAFQDAVSDGYSTILLLSSLPEALIDAEHRFAEFAHGTPAAPAVVAVVAPDALLAATRGDTAAVAEALTLAVVASATKADAILLAQYSLAPAADELSRRTGLPVISGPPRAAVRMRAALLGDTP